VAKLKVILLYLSEEDVSSDEFEWFGRSFHYVSQVLTEERLHVILWPDISFQAYCG
jgi:hypothetical protein